LGRRRITTKVKEIKAYAIQQQYKRRSKDTIQVVIMKIYFERSGGFAGMINSTTIDTQNLLLKKQMK
jgi:hypothetical protein